MAKVYLVLHHEVINSDQTRIYESDHEMVFYVVSDLKTAIDAIKTAGVCEYSWWEIQEAEIDNIEWPTHVGWYNTKGRKQKNHPMKKMIELYKKNKKK